MTEGKKKLISLLIKNIENFNAEKLDFSFLNIFLAFKKNYLFIIKVLLFIFIGINTHTVIVRIFNPVFKGNFVLLISDPLNRDEKSFNGKSSVSIEETALGRTKNDIPTLVAFLQSSYNLSPIAKDLKISLNSLKEKIKISSTEVDPDSKSPEFAGIIKVDYFSRNPSKDIKNLDYISKKFIYSANNLRLEKLKGGLNFLENQEPIFKNKLDSIQNEISEFRERNSLIKPNLEGEKIKNEERKILTLITSLENDIKRLNDIKFQILNNNLITSGFDETISKRGAFDKPNTLAKGLSVSSSAGLLLAEFNKVESELAKAKSIYSDESKIVRALKERVEKIKPNLKQKQIEAVDSAIDFNLARKNALQIQRNNLNLKFKEMPKLISEYNLLINNLKTAEQNLTSIIDAKEKLKLEIAQNSVAWIIIEPPSFDSRPKYPSIFKRFISSIFISIFVGFLIALYKEKIDNSFNTVREIRKKYEKYLILGTLP